MIGHLLGGAGGIEAVATIKAIETGACLDFYVILKCLFICVVVKDG